MKTRLNSKGGFSVAEVIIALSIIVAVSVAAMVMVISSMSVKTTLVARSEGINFAENALECFKAADGFGEFEKFLEEAIPDGETYTETETVIETYVYKYAYIFNKFTAEITVAYPDGGRPTFKIDVTEKDDEDSEIISFTYTKGAK